jgi:hypothetical protein
VDFLHEPRTPVDSGEVVTVELRSSVLAPGGVTAMAETTFAGKACHDACIPDALVVTPRGTVLWSDLSLEVITVTP